ncbi:MAG: NADH-quinone oxidoreductase subunit L, partial [Devosia sp.]|nr:NADH-quinone oxidoreductase subunit L [Devosia sp.]
EQSETALAVVTIVGATTAFFAATVGLVQNDIKRVIAYSTCSQLGYMFVGLGVGGYSLGIFHLFTHAFFKALLFLGAGSVIHAMHHEQDMRNMGGLAKKIPFTFATMTFGTLALTGFPLTAGYFSKDAIIEAAYAAGLHSQAATYAYVLTVVAAGLTSFYSWRLVFMTFFGKPRWEEVDHSNAAAMAAVHSHDHESPAEEKATDEAHGHGDHGQADHGHDDHGHQALDPHESPNTMMIPLYVLSIGALFAGLVFKGAFIGHEMGEFWRGSLFFGPDNHIMHEMHEIPAFAGLLPSLLMALGFVVSFYFYIVSPQTPVRLAERLPGLYRFLLNKWYFDELYDVLFVRPAFWLGRLFWKGGDGAIIDRLGPDGIAARVLDGSKWTARLQTGYIYNYAFAMLIGLAAIITYYLVGGVR